MKNNVVFCEENDNENSQNSDDTIVNNSNM